MTPHFSKAELTCKCGCGLLPEESFMAKVEQLRLVYGKPMPITSGARCALHNGEVSSTGDNGPHTKRRAIDVAIRGEDAVALLRIALSQGFTGIGVSQKGASRFLHLDDLPNGPGCPRPMIWSY
jgi:uncharacterized protein YcbK (DUF882 family)